jgi:hypothetical protein
VKGRAELLYRTDWVYGYRDRASRHTRLIGVDGLADRLRRPGMTKAELDRVFATFNAASPALAAARREG